MTVVLEMLSSRVQCPECLVACHYDELEAFDGLCEACSQRRNRGIMNENKVNFCDGSWKPGDSKTPLRGQDEE